MLPTSEDVPDKWSAKFIFKYYSAWSALKYCISFMILALTLNQVRKFENSGKLLQQRVDNKSFGGELWLVVVGHQSLLIHLENIANEFMILRLCCQVVLMFIANIFSSRKARSLSILTPFKMEFLCILILLVSSFLDVGKYLSIWYDLYWKQTY